MTHILYTIRTNEVQKRLDDLARRLSPAAANMLYGGNHETTSANPPLAAAGGDPVDRYLPHRLRSLQAGG